MAKAAIAAKPSFASLLDTPGSEIERPKPLPVGTYVCMVQGLPRFDKSSKKQTDFVEFTLKLLEAGEDVDADELKAMGGLIDKTIKDTYYITESALWRLKEFLTNCGLDADDDTSLRELIEEAPGKQVGVVIKHEASQDGTSVFARVAKTIAVE